MKTKNRPFVPFRHRRLWLVYWFIILVLWLAMATVTLGYTERHHATPVSVPSFQALTPVVIWTPTPIPLLF